MSRAESLESGTRGRTRRAILGAAASVLGRDYNAPLSDIADAAGVGRTTLHRYFPDRAALVEAAIQDSVEALQRSIADAALDQGSSVAAMRRLVAALVAVGDRLVFLFGDPRIFREYGVADAPDSPGPPDDPVLALIRRGQAEGVFDPEVNAEWIQHVLWALVYTGYEEAENCKLPRHGVVSTVIRTLENGIRPHSRS